MSKQGKQQRSFKVKLNTEEKAHGRYTGDSPYQAANKALSEIIRQRKRDGLSTHGKINFTLIESTKNSKHKSHEYVGRRVKLPSPVEYQVGGGQTIVKKYKNELKKVKISQKKK